MVVLLLAAATQARAECVCLFAGGSVTHGETACIKTAEGQSLARCEKNQNVSSWNILNLPCPQVSAAPSPKSADDILQTRLSDVPDRVIN